MVYKTRERRIFKTKLMTPKDKAEELYNKYIKYCNELSHDKNKVLCKLMVDDCINETLKYADKRSILFLEQVKQEIYKL
jgi:hypothetical protein